MSRKYEQVYNQKRLHSAREYPQTIGDVANGRNDLIKARAIVRDARIDWNDIQVVLPVPWLQMRVRSILAGQRETLEVIARALTER
jgi:hypothetical protein